MAMCEGAQTKVALPPLPQRVWGGLAVMNFTCGGAGTGAVVGILALALAAPVFGRAVRVIEALGIILAGAGSGTGSAVGS